ncbi:MAG: hypothetical protein JW941_11830 [Candidatus Coatesbacteria bacterium]|nr:hypothetical protein [Candidatus Coatesbacteria bacterium]
MAASHTKWLQGILHGSVSTVSGLHVGGAPVNGDTVSTSFVRDERGRPFLPGSTLKGALRNQIQSAIKALQDAADGPISACDFPESIEQKSLRFCGQTGDRSKLCTACQLFGSTLNPSRIFVRDLILSSEWSDVFMQRKSTMGISRGFGRGLKGSERTIEVIPEGAEFAFQMIVSEPHDWELGLIFWAMERFRDGLGHLGGGRRLGLGQVDIKLNKVVVQRTGPGLTLVSESFTRAADTEIPEEVQTAEAETAISIPKPTTDNMGEVLRYCLELMTSRGITTDAGELGKLLSSEFGLSKQRRRELNLPEKVSELLDEMVKENKLEKNYLGHYSMSPDYVNQELPEEAEETEAIVSDHVDLKEFQARCMESLERLLFGNKEAAPDA